MAEVLGVLTTPSSTVAAVRKLKGAGFDQVDVYSPVASHELEEAVGRGPSRVRTWTLVGCLTGVTLGYAMQIWMAYNWPVVVGGKPFMSIPPYTIIGFELNILFGAILTVVGLIVHGIALAHRGRNYASYRPSFSGDEFGCVVRCHSEHIPRVQELLRSAGSTEVRVVHG